MDTINSRSAKIAGAQGLYYLATGLWPLFNIRSFEAVTGPKREDWLVKTVGAVVTAIGAALTVSWKKGRASDETRVLGIASAAAFTLIDCTYVLKGRISPIYLLDAAAEAALIVAWCLPAKPPRTMRSVVK